MFSLVSRAEQARFASDPQVELDVVGELRDRIAQALQLLNCQVERSRDPKVDVGGTVGLCSFNSDLNVITIKCQQLIKSSQHGPENNILWP